MEKGQGSDCVRQHEDHLTTNYAHFMITGSCLKYKGGLKPVNPLFQTLSLSELTLSKP